MPPASSSDLFGDFLGQLPPLLFVMVCGSGILLFAAFAWFAYFKPRRSKMLAGGSSSTPMPTNSNLYSDDMPDLDSLLDTSALQSEPDMQPAPRPEPPSTAPAAAPPPSANRGRVRLDGGSNIRAEEVVRILRDPRDDRLIVEVDGTGYRTLVDTPDTKKRFVKIMQELSTVVNEPDENPPEPVEISSEPPPPATPDGAMPGDLPKYNMDDGVVVKQRGPLGGVKMEAAPLPELNIAASIEAYLQHKLRHTPEYSDVNLHVHSAPGGGVQIQVDDTYYEAVSDVDDPEIRQFLATTIEEWQERQ